MRVFPVLAMIPLLLAPSPIRAALESDREVVQTIAHSLLHLQKSEAARDLLMEHLQEDPRDAQSWKLLGFLYLERKSGGEAFQAFAQSAKNALGTQKAVAIYHQARAAQLMGKLPQAQSLLASIQETRALRASVRQAQADLRAGDSISDLQLTPPLSGRLVLGLQSGFDNNVLLMSDSTLLSASQTETQSVVTHGSALGSLRIPTLTQFEIHISGGSQFLFPWSSATQAFRGILPTLDVGGTWKRSVDPRASFLAKNLEHGLRLHSDLLFLNTDGLSFFFTQGSLHHEAELRLHPRWKLHSEFTVRYQKFALVSGQTEDTDRSGPGIRGRLTGDFLGSFGRLSLGVEAEIHQALGTQYRSRTLSPVLQAQLQLPAAFSLIPELAYAYTPFPVSSSLRVDHHLRIQALLSKAFGESLSVSFSWLSQFQTSNLDAANYKRHQGLLGIQYAIF